MTTKTWDVTEWQRRFRSGQKVYWTSCLGEATGNYYESREAAELEQKHNAAKRDSYTYPPINIHTAHIHTLELSKERWQGD